MVRLRGQWVEVDAKGLQRALTAMQRRGSGQMTVADLFGALASGAAGPGGLPVLDIEADGWLGDLLSGAPDRQLEPVPAPPGFTGVLRPYQERGLAWLAFLDALGLGAVLADDMGLGKTVQLLALVARDRLAAAAATVPTLLVCPMSLVGNWQREAARFVPDLRVHIHHGADRAKGEAFAEAVATSDLVVTTYSIAARDAEDLGAVTWRRIVLDEAQAVKNAATRQAQAVRALPAAHRVAVTGTPVENRLADLWSIMEFANPGLLGGATSFKQRFAVPIERHADDDAAARLRTLTQPFVLRRVKTDRSIISDLPDKLEMEVLCSLTSEQAALYKAVVDDMLERIETSEGIERRGLVLATMTKLKQVCNHPAQMLRDGSRLAGRSGKLARVEETLEEVLAAGERALLFTQFAEFGGMLRAHLSARFGREVLFLHGGVPKADRDAMVERFSSADVASPALFVLSLKAGGTGLNLTAANHVIHVDRWWNPAVEDQATDRAFRIGQTRAVQVRKLVCAGTLEERIATMITEKRGLAARIVGTGEGWLTELSTAQLRELLRLEESAVMD
jgi:non-specific serine/threonine protein kinase